MGVIVESAVTPIVIIAHSLISSTSCTSALIEIVLQVIKNFQKIEMKRIDAIKRGNKDSSYITHHNRQSDSTFLIGFGQGL